MTATVKCLSNLRTIYGQICFYTYTEKNDDKSKSHSALVACFNAISDPVLGFPYAHNYLLCVSLYFMFVRSHATNSKIPRVCFRCALGRAMLAEGLNGGGGGGGDGSGCGGVPDGGQGAPAVLSIRWGRGRRPRDG